MTSLSRCQRAPLCVKIMVSMLLAHGGKSLLPPLVLLPPTHAPSGYVDDERCSLGSVDMVGPELVGQTSDPTYVAPTTLGRQLWSSGIVAPLQTGCARDDASPWLAKAQTHDDNLLTHVR